MMDTFLCFEGTIVEAVTYSETFNNAENLTKFFKECVHNECCILLFMTNNVHIPAIILSLQTLGHSFMFIDVNSSNLELEELIKFGSIHFIFSSLEVPLLKDFRVVKNIQLKNDHFQLHRTNFESDGREEKLGYAIFCIMPTSGTTGRKKLIKIQNHCIKQNVNALNKIFRLSSEDVIYFGTPLTFDPSLVELLLAFEVKASLIIVPENTKLNAESLFKTLFPKSSDYPIPTFIQMVPSVFLRWSETQIEYILKGSQLKILALGGEPFPKQILNTRRNLRLFNLYGITEISCWATANEIMGTNEVFIGNPLEETLLKVCVEGKEVAFGTGELFIGSNTRHCFINDECETSTWRGTGDIVEKTENGIKYLGRKDSWVKRFGYRISLDEIESKVYEQINLPSKSVWLAIPMKLLLFFSIPSIIQQDKSRILDKLRAKLLHVLSKEELPDFVDIVGNFPITNNGKIDKSSLLEIYRLNESPNTEEEMPNFFLVQLAKYLGQSLLNYRNIKNLTFIEIGGNSILYTSIINSLKCTFNCNFPSEFFTLLLNESIEKCMEFLIKFQHNFRPIRKSQKVEILLSRKKTKYLNVVEAVWKHNLHGCVDATPLIFERKNEVMVAVGSFSNYFAVLNAATGDIKFLELFSDAIGSEASISTSKDFLYFGCFDGNLVCLNLENFRIEWRYKTGNSIKCTPSFCNNEENVVFGSYDKYLHCVDAKTGKCIWKTYIQESIITTPELHKSSNQILVTTLLGSLFAVSESTGDVQWSIKLQNPIFCQRCLLCVDHLFFSDVCGTIYSIDLQTKKNILDFTINNEIYSSIRKAGDCFVFSDRSGFLYKCSLLNSDTNVVKLNLNESISTTPCIFECCGKLLIASVTIHGNLYLVDFHGMKILSHWKCEGDVYSSPVYYNQRIFIGCRDDNIHCFKITL